MTQFSVILPVRNGMPFVKECVASILAQTHRDFDLLVLDNESTDGTAEWIEGLRDERIRVQRSDRSLSITESWGRIKSLSSKREFMTMIGHDDLLDPKFLELIATLIARHPDAALYQTGSRLINSKGKTIRSTKPVPPRESAAQYLAARLTYQRDVFGTGYVMRSADYDRLGGIPPFERLFFADDALWMLLLRQSYKASDPTETFSVRIHSQSESASVPSLWPSFLRGLCQFDEFMRDYVKANQESAEVYGRLGAGFYLRYMQNVLIFALVEASQKGRRLDPIVRGQIRASLQRMAGDDVADRLMSSPRVRVVDFLNFRPFRGYVNRIWSTYQRAMN
jgi:glycosyltransferase involved in cell wall biosynthesis